MTSTGNLRKQNSTEGPLPGEHSLAEENETEKRLFGCVGNLTLEASSEHACLYECVGLNLGGKSQHDFLYFVLGNICPRLSLHKFEFVGLFIPYCL